MNTVQEDIVLFVPSERIGYGVDFHLKNAENGLISRVIDQSYSRITLDYCTVDIWSMQDAQRAINYEDYIEQLNEIEYPTVTCYTIPDGQRFIHIASQITTTTNMFIQIAHSTFSPHRDENWKEPFTIWDKEHEEDE